MIEGCPHGNGKLMNENGEKYIGLFKFGKKFENKD